MSPSMLASGGALQPFVLQVLAFVILIAVLAKLAIPVLAKILRGRSQGIEDTFTKLDQDTKDTAKRIEEIKAKLANMEKESQARLQAALDDANRTRAQLLSEATAQVQAAFEKAKREIQIERDKATHELRERTIQLVTEAAEHVAKSAVTEDLQNRLVDGYIEKINTVEKL